MSSKTYIKTTKSIWRLEKIIKSYALFLKIQRKAKR